MFYLPPTLISIIEVLLVIIPALLSVAYVTVAERKTMASMQRRLGPNAVGQPKFNSPFKRSGPPKGGATDRHPSSGGVPIQIGRAHV